MQANKSKTWALHSHRRQRQQAQLAADGAKAHALIDEGRSIVEIMRIIPGSRARLYRAMAIASQQSVDSLLL